MIITLLPIGFLCKKKPKNMGNKTETVIAMGKLSYPKDNFKNELTDLDIISNALLRIKISYITLHHEIGYATILEKANRRLDRALYSHNCNRHWGFQFRARKSLTSSNLYTFHVFCGKTKS